MSKRMWVRLGKRLKNNRIEIFADVAVFVCLCFAIATIFDVKKECEAEISGEIKMLISAEIESETTMIETESETTTEEETTTVEVFTGYSFIPLDTDLQIQIKALCDEYGHDYLFWAGWCYTESSFNIYADNGSCKGLMQIKESVHKEWLEALGYDLFDPLQNVEFAFKLFDTYLLRTNGDINEALYCYCSNEGYIDKVWQNVAMMIDAAEEEENK